MYKTPEQVRQWLRSQDKTISDWSRENGYTVGDVLRVLSGQSKLQRGRGREIARKLGMAVPE